MTDKLANEHPTLSATTDDLVSALSKLPGELQPAAGGAVWMHHHEFAERTEQLARHLKATITLAEAGLFPSALALTRTALEHHLLDRLLLLADRYEEVIRPPDETQIDQWEREWVAKDADWTRDVVSIRRVRNGTALELVRIGHKVVDQAGNVTERISPYWVALEHYDAFVGHPDLQATTTRPFRSVEDLEQWARRNQALYAGFLKWSSICWNLQLSTLASPSDVVQLQIHYSFLSAFTHATNSGYDAHRRVRRPGPSADHVLGELVLLYAAVIAAREIAAWRRYITQRPQLLAPLSAPFAELVERAETIVGYFWFLIGGPQPYDACQEANRRADPQLRSGRRPEVAPDELTPADVGYYADPLERLVQMHIGGTELMTGFGFPPAWPILHW